MYQLCKRDEYGQTSIEASSNNPKALIKQAKTMVTDENFDNALTMDFKELEWESYLPEFIDNEGNPLEDVYYGGPGTDNKGVIYVVGDGDEVKKYKLGEVDFNVKFFIGNENKGKASPTNPHYALGWFIEVDANKKKTRIRKEIDVFDHDDLKSKSVYFIVKK